MLLSTQMFLYPQCKKWQLIPGSVLEFAFEGIIVPVHNTEIVNEYREVLAREKFGLQKIL